MNLSCRTLIVALAVLALRASPAIAQTCLGGPDLEQGATQLLVGGVATEGKRGLDAGIGSGTNGFFNTATVSFNRFDGFAQTQFGIAALVGTQITGGRAGAVGVCPIGGFEYSFGPSTGSRSLRTFTVRMGGSVGIVAGSTESFSLVPLFSAVFIRQIDTVTTSVSVNKVVQYGLASVGVSFRFNHHQTAIAPVLSVPFGSAGGDLAFSVRLTTNF